MLYRITGDIALPASGCAPRTPARRAVWFQMCCTRVRPAWHGHHVRTATGVRDERSILDSSRVAPWVLQWIGAWLHHHDFDVGTMCGVSPVFEEGVKALLTAEPTDLNACGLFLTHRTDAIEHLQVLDALLGLTITCRAFHGSLLKELYT